MIQMQGREISQEFDCPYIATNKSRNEHFFAMDLKPEELSISFKLVGANLAGTTSDQIAMDVKLVSR